MKTLIFSGFGLNCENETAYACEQVGFSQVEVHHINQLYSGTLDVFDYAFVVMIGGFMDGDDLGAARAGTNRYTYRPLPGGEGFLEQLHRFVEQGRLVLGICNGFQLLVKLGLLPGRTEDAHRQQVSLTTNDNGRFEDRWVHLRVDPDSPSIYTRGLEQMELPIRHGEGRLVGATPELTDSLVNGHLSPLRYCTPEGEPTSSYPHNPNGSPHGMASLCNPQGTVMGLMPHPEAYNHYTNHPRWTRKPAPTDEAGEGLALFKNAHTYLKG